MAKKHPYTQTDIEERKKAMKNNEREPLPDIYS
jgi:hypothetical protein